MQQDKRKQKRLGTNLFVDLVSPSGMNLGRGVVLDVSLSGFAMDTEADLIVDDDLICHIEVPIMFKAKVMRSIHQGQVKRYGLRFVDQSFIDKFLLKKVLKGKRRTNKISR